MVVGEKVSLEEMGGARMHCTVSGCGDLLAVDDADAIEQARLLFSYLPTCWREQPPSYPAEAPVRELDVTVVPGGGEPAVRRARGHRRPGRRRVVLRDQAAVRGRARGRLRPARRRGRRCRREQLGGARRGAVLRQRRQGGPVHLAVRRLQRPAALPGRRPRLHDRLRGRARRHHPARRQDDLGGRRGHRAPGLRGRPQGVRRRALRHGRSRASGRTPASRCRPPGSRSWDPRRRSMRCTPTRSRRSPTRPSGRRSWPSAAPSTRPTSTSSGWLSDLVLDGVVEPAELRAELVNRYRYAVGRSRHFSDRRHGVPPV